ncbi:MAG: hypothetical protein ACXWB9_05970, partial [Flavisolibacter sp.]
MNGSSLHTHLPKRNLLIFGAGLLLLSLISAWYFNVQPSAGTQQRYLENYIQDQEEDAIELLKDTMLMRKLVLKTETLKEFREIERKKYGLFLFAETISETQDLLFWNNQKILPPMVDFNLPDGAYFQHLENGYYVVIKNTLRFSGMSNTISAYVMIPVLHQYYLETDYLLSRFAHDADAHRLIAPSDVATELAVTSLSGKKLFYLKEVTHSKVMVTDTVTILLRLSALVFLLVYLHIVAENITRKRRALHSIIFLGISFFVLRLIIYQFPGLFSFRQFDLFDPLIYATNEVNASLGDLLINSILLCWLIIFAWFNMGPVQKVPSLLKDIWVYIWGIVLIFILIFFSFQFANLISSLVSDSKISFNVTNFFSLDKYTVIGLIVLALLSLSYYYFTRILFRFIFPVFRNRFIYIYFILFTVGLLYLTLRSGNDIVLFHLPVLVWLMIYTLLVSQEKFIINRFRMTVAGALFWIFIFSVSLAAVILQGNKQNELSIRKGIAEKYDQLTDPTNDHTMSIAITYLDNRFLVRNFNRFRTEPQNSLLRDSILRQNFTSYNARYDTRIYVFDSLNRPVNNRNDPKSYPELNTLFTVQSKSTGIPDLNYIESSFDRLTYITRRIIRDTIGQVGSFFIISTPRQYAGTSDALYPELFRQVSRRDDNNASIYSYAIYNDKLLISSSDKYPFQIHITNAQIPKSEYEERKNGANTELWYKPSGKKVVVVAKKRNSLIEHITLFSYLFCAFLFMVGLLQLISLILRVFRERGSFNLFARLNIR